MKVGLFIPCYVDQFYPQTGIACLSLLKKLGCEVHYPTNQTCCGQPMANSGYEHLTGGCNSNFIENFKGFDFIVCPSGSCALHIKEHLHDSKQEDLATDIRSKVYELTEFIVDILKVTEIKASFPHKVGIHQSCHGLRGLKISQMSELNAPSFSKPVMLLSNVRNIDIKTLNRNDDCCGFGGTFCVTEEAVSVRMGQDRITDHTENGVEYITSVDLSCLMHLEGILKRQGSNIKVIHIAEILNHND